MELSIIIPSLNEEKNIGNILKDLSIQGMSKGNIEVLVADAGSKDKTCEIAKSYGAKIIDGGLPGVARNKGSKIAKGNILYFMDSDIRINKNFLENSSTEFENKHLDVAGIDNHLLYDDSIKFSDKIVIDIINRMGNILFRFDEHGKRPKAVGTCMVFDRKSFLESGGFDENIYWGEDTEIAQRMKKEGYKFGILKTDKIYTNPRKILKHGILKYYSNVIKLNKYRETRGEITSKAKYQEITGISDYFALNKEKT